MRSCGAVLVSWVLIGCGASTGVASGSDASVVADVATTADVVETSNDLRGEVHGDCAPNDGPALTFIIDATPVACGVTPTASPQFRLTYWAPVPSAPNTFSVGAGEFSSGSSGTWCSAAGVCQPATAGRLTLTSFSTAGNDAAGSVTLILRDGSAHTATFSGLLRCPGFVGCG